MANYDSDFDFYWQTQDRWDAQAEQAQAVLNTRPALEDIVGTDDAEQGDNDECPF